MKWRTMDLHIHTPASSDYQQPEIDYLDLLKQAEVRRLDIIAFTDHNTVAGYRRMTEEIQQLEVLEDLGRLLPEEKQRLNEFRRLLKKILVLPGFEFTATLGFHILGIFPPEKSVREIEHLLLDLNIPDDSLVSIDQALNMPDDEVVIMCTGSQGEPASILGRLAKGTYNLFDIKLGDTVIHSSHPIPGNEEKVYSTINRLLQRGADVVYEAVAQVHVSGHASQEEQKMMLNLVKP